MSEVEIDLARGYLAAADQDPVAALIRSVKELARTRRMLASLPDLIAGLHDDDPPAQSLQVLEDTRRLAA